MTNSGSASPSSSGVFTRVGSAHLRRLSDLSVQLSIDDFGTGYSSLSNLSRLPMSKLKIDRSVIKDMLTEPTDRAITEAIIALAHRLEMTVVAEGVETAAIHAALIEARCDTIQGYFTGRPMAPEALERWIGASAHGTVAARQEGVHPGMPGSFAPSGPPAP